MPFIGILFLYLGAYVETGSCRAHSLTLSMPLSPPHKRAYRPVFYWYYLLWRSWIQQSHDGSFVRTTYNGKGWACDTTGVDQDNFVHGRWTRMVNVPHVGEWKYSFRYRGRATSIHCLFLLKAIVSTITTEECETRQPSELGMFTTPSFLMYHSVDYKVGYKVTTFSLFLSIYFLSNVFHLYFFKTQLYLCLF